MSNSALEKWWEFLDKKQGYGVTLSRWEKEGDTYCNITYWTCHPDKPLDRLRVNVIGKGLIEAVEKAERREAVLRGKAEPEPLETPLLDPSRDWFPC